MSNEIRGVSATGTLYARLMNSSGQVWNTSGLAFEPYSSANYADYAISMAEQGNSGVYCADFPPAITAAGTYEYFIHRQAGASPVEDSTIDKIINTGKVDWTGSQAASTTSASATLLVTEALKKAGISSPSTAEISRASDYWLQEILNDIWMKTIATGNTRLRSLQETLIDVSTAYVQTWDMPEDLDEEVIVEVLDGTRYSTAQAGAANSITLASSDSGTVASTRGRNILITSGDGVDEFKKIIDYDVTTKIATVDSAWTTTPTSSSTYLIVDSYDQIDEVDLTELSSTAAAPGKPTAFARYNRSFTFDRPWDRSTYGLRVQYFMNIHSIDTSGGATSRWGRIITNWKNVLTLGVYYKALEDADDQRCPQAKVDYEAAVLSLVMKEIPYGGAFQGFSV